MKRYFMKYSEIVTVVLLMCMLTLLFFSGVQLYLFTQNVHELAQMKESYATYIQGLKRTIAEQQERGVEEQDSSVKKKKQQVSRDFRVETPRVETLRAEALRVENSSASDQAPFRVVNRDVEYLRTRARMYARRNGIEEQWSQATHSEGLGIGEKKVVRRSGMRSPARTRRIQRVVALESDVAMVLREHPFIAPIDKKLFWISSPFGPRRKRDGSWGFHYGLDMAAPFGTPVKSVAQGVVVEAKMDKKGFGKHVVVSHSNKLRTRYAHLSRIEVAVGDTVEQGQRVGRVGNTGNTRGRNGVHLHFEVLIYGKQIDPRQFFKSQRFV